MSYGWWMDKHTRHHNNPNHDDLDPDVRPEVLIRATKSGVGPTRSEGFHHPPPGRAVLRPADAGQH
jgi:fatty acid desaturase